MIATVLAAGNSGIEPGKHWDPLGIGLNLDTVIYTVIACAIVIALGLFVRAKVTAGVPGRLQLFMETVNDLARKQVEDSIGIKVAPFVVPLAFSLFFFLLVANWLSVLHIGDVIEPPTADANLAYALAFFVLIWVHVFGIRNQGKHYFSHYLKPFPVMLPMEILTQLARFLSLPLRLFGNMFAGTIMLALLANLLPPYISWVGNTGWKLFDLFVGAMQAFIFTLLTIIYFGEFADSHSEEEATAH